MVITSIINIVWLESG